MKMLQYFIKQTLWLSLTLLSILSIFMSMRHEPSSSSKLDMYHLHDCKLPCWIGIFPGKTTVGEAQTLIKETYPSDDYDFSSDHSPYTGENYFTLKNRMDGNELLISFNGDEDPTEQSEGATISQITISAYPPTNLLLGDWFDVLRTPDALSITWGNHSAWPNALYLKQGVRLTLDINFDKFTLASPFISADTLDIYDHMDSVYPPSYRVIWQNWQMPVKNQVVALMLP